MVSLKLHAVLKINMVLLDGADILLGTPPTVSRSPVLARYQMATAW